MPFVHVAIAVEGVGASDKDCLALSLATALLGSWDRTHGGGKIVANRLAAQSHEYGLCHSFEAFNINYRDTGLWGIYFVGEHKIQDVSESVEVFVVTGNKCESVTRNK